VEDLESRLRKALAGRYRVEREVGHGGMAVVYLARDLRIERQVAIKVLRPELAASLGPERFLREIKVAANLAHPHILPLHDSGEADDLLYFVMPFVEGESLRERLTREGRLPVADALQIAREVVGALDYAHAHDVVHRDIKPENILLQAGQAVVADFGIARAISAAAEPRMTAAGVAVGTVAYMSPEQTSGEHELDGRSDVYSLGCVLYEMLAGRPPFAAATAVEIMSWHRTQPVPPLGRPGVPPGVERAVERALAKRPGDRFQSAAEFAHALATTDEGMARRGWRAAVRRHPWATAAAAMALGAIGVAVVPGVGGAKLDDSLYAVVPFGTRGDAPELLDGDHCESVLYAALSRWEDVRLVSGLRVHDLLLRLGPGPLTLTRALALARDLGAGRLVWGESSAVGDSVQVRGVLYDVRSGGRLVREHTVRVGKDLGDIEDKLGQIGDSLLIGRVRSPHAVGGVIGTGVLAAWQAYEDGHAARARWDLPGAERAFRAALELDPAYPQANLWLAQVLLWAGRPAEAWRDYAAAAGRSAPALVPRDSGLAGGLGSLAARAYLQACDVYHRLLARDTLDAEAWFGLGECQRQDRLVERDPESPSGWRFRSSYHAAAQAYRRALEIVPAAHRAFAGAAVERLGRLLYTEANVYRGGYTAGPDTLWFGAWPALAADTLALVPYPLADLLAGAAGTWPVSLAAAVRSNREELRRLSAGWVQAFPASADAHEILGLTLETLGEVSEGPGVERSAILAVGRARVVARDTAQALRLAAADVRLRLKREEWGRARALADSLVVAWPGPGPVAAGMLAGLAALTGRIERTAVLLALTAPLDTPLTWDGERVPVAQPVNEAGLRLLAYASFGAPAESLVVLERRVGQRVVSWVTADERDRARAALLHVPVSLAFPALAPHPLHDRPSDGNYLLALQGALLRGDSVAVRSRLTALRQERADRRPGDVAIDGTLGEALVLLALGDTAAVTALLDLSLDALPTLGTDLVGQVPQAAGLARAMALRAELAHAAGDRVTAKRWARAVLELWAGADAALEAVVRRMRAIADSR
jgi:tRNA A-37 threonylcarbamoyl transferase component Bud32/tetratricopeptide (TPR) repeat protein